MYPSCCPRLLFANKKETGNRKTKTPFCFIIYLQRGQNSTKIYWSSSSGNLFTRNKYDWTTAHNKSNGLFCFRLLLTFPSFLQVMPSCHAIWCHTNVNVTMYFNVVYGLLYSCRHTSHTGSEIRTQCCKIRILHDFQFYNCLQLYNSMHWRR